MPIKKSLYFPYYYFTIFPILALHFWKIAPILSPIFSLETTWSPAFFFRSLVGIFSNTLMCPLPHSVLKNHFPFQNVKCQKWKAAVLEGFRLTCLLDSAREKPNDWRNCWNKLSQLANHRVLDDRWRFLVPLTSQVARASSSLSFSCWKKEQLWLISVFFSVANRRWSKLCNYWSGQQRQGRCQSTKRWSITMDTGKGLFQSREKGFFFQHWKCSRPLNLVWTFEACVDQLVV